MAPSPSESSSSSSFRFQRRPFDLAKPSPKNLKRKTASHSKRRHSYRSPSSSDYYRSESSDGELETCDHSRKRKRNPNPKKAKVNGRSKSGRRKSHKHRIEEADNGPVQLSKFLGREEGDDARRSSVSGKKILLKVEKTKEDKLEENKRNELLKFLNASFD